ncbi:MAG TPA: pseudouridine synthase [Solimonas sp.]
MSSGERIQKALATAGVASRREVERLIEEGRITVNGKPAEVGQKVEAGDHIRVDGRPVALNERTEAPRVLLYKKRVGEIVTRDDPEGRRTVFRKLPELKQGRWIAVGRLDLNTSGLLLFTNHGELARRLTHPSFEIPRVYAVRVLGTVDEEILRRLVAGVELEDGVGRFVRIEPGDNEDGEGANQWYRVVVREGRNRFVRRMIESQGLQVSRLIRTAYGPLELGRGIKSGTAREAEPQELLALLDAVGLEDDSAKRRPSRRRGDAPRSEVAPSSRPAPKTGSHSGPRSDSRSGSRPVPGKGPQNRSRRGPPRGR